MVALNGMLAAEDAIMNWAAAAPSLLENDGRAVVFSSLENLTIRIDLPDLEVEPDDILVLQNAGPRSPSKMPQRVIWRFERS